MSDRLQHLEKAVSELNPTEFKQFAAWMADLDQQVWEQEIENDAKEGRLNFLVEEARRERKAGKLKEI